MITTKTAKLKREDVPLKGTTIEFIDWTENPIKKGPAVVIEVHWHGPQNSWVDITIRMTETGHWSTQRIEVT